MLFYLNLIYIFMCIYLLPVVPGQCVICSLFSHIFNIYIYIYIFYFFIFIFIFFLNVYFSMNCFIKYLCFSI